MCRSPPTREVRVADNVCGQDRPPFAPHGKIALGAALVLQAAPVAIRLLAQSRTVSSNERGRQSSIFCGFAIKGRLTASRRAAHMLVRPCLWVFNHRGAEYIKYRLMVVA